MKKWSDIEISPGGWEELVEVCGQYKNFNPACRLTPYWSERVNKKIIEKTFSTGHLGYGFVGDGWPMKSDQSAALGMDTLCLRNAFLEHDSRDVGDAIYQANVLLPLIAGTQDHLIIYDFGAGYGRLAIPFIHALRGRMTYIGVDYVPASLHIAPQFLAQAVDAVCREWNGCGDILGYDYVALPAWRLEELRGLSGHLFISTHSFQEMELDTVNWYIDWISANASDSACLYSVNLWPAKYVPENWVQVFDRGYPINRDGPYNEKLWRVP